MRAIKTACSILPFEFDLVGGSLQHQRKTQNSKCPQKNFKETQRQFSIENKPNWTNKRKKVISVTEILHLLDPTRNHFCHEKSAPQSWISVLLRYRFFYKVKQQETYNLKHRSSSALDSVLIAYVKISHLCGRRFLLPIPNSLMLYFV